MKIHIIGAGAIGLLIGAKLSINNDISYFVRREEQAEKLLNEGLHYKSNRESFTAKVNAHLIEDYEPADLTFVTVKSYDIKSVLPYLKDASNLVFLQNGLSHIDLVRQFSNLYLGIVEHGAVRVTDNCVEQRGFGRIKVAAFHKEDSLDVFARLNKDDFPFIRAEDYEAILHEKLLANAVINPLTALLNVNNGQLLENRSFKNIAKALSDEVAELLQLEKEAAWSHVQQVIWQTSDNISSMCIDVRHKQRTEVEAILGYLLNISDKNYPNIYYTYHAIKGIERGYLNG